MFMIQLAIVKKRAPQKAEAKSTTKKPLTIEDANQNIKAFITKVNNPKVNMFTGKVRTNKMGFIIALIKPRTNAAIRAV